MDIDKKLRRLFFYYALAGLLFLTALSGVIISTRYENFLSGVLRDLEKGRQNLLVMQGAIADMDAVIAGVDQIAPPHVTSRAPETQILISLDGLKSRMRDAEIIVASFQYRGDEVNLPVVIKGPLKDYADFVNAVGYLQLRGLPVFDISTILLSQSPDKTVSYEIMGDFRTLKGRRK